MPPVLPLDNGEDPHRPAAFSATPAESVGAVARAQDDLERARVAFLAARTYRERRKALQRLEELKARKAHG